MNSKPSAAPPKPVRFELAGKGSKSGPIGPVPKGQFMKVIKGDVGFRPKTRKK